MNDRNNRRCPICGGTLSPERRICDRPKRFQNLEKADKEITVTVAGTGRGAARVRIKVKQHGGTPHNTYTMYCCAKCNIGFHYKDTLPPKKNIRPNYKKLTVREFLRQTTGL